MSEQVAMTVKQAMAFVSDVKSMLVFDSKPPCWKKALLVLADEVERLKWNNDIAEAALLSVEKERDELRRRVAELLPALEDALEYLQHHLPDEALVPHRAAIANAKTNQIEGGA